MASAALAAGVGLVTFYLVRLLLAREPLGRLEASAGEREPESE